MSQWILDGRGDYDKLRLEKQTDAPHVGDNDVLVKMKAASFNFRDIAIVKEQYPFPTKPSVVPLSDGAGVVKRVGSNVTRFAPGDRVAPIFTQAHLSGAMTPNGYHTTLGGPRDGVMRSLAAFNEETLVKLPEQYDFVQGAALLAPALLPGQWVLVQGTGGVSLFGLQFAKACGARVVATTSSAEKAQRLKDLGADHVVNYREDANWGVTARAFTPDNTGFHHIIDVGGSSTLRQSLQAIAIEGVISIVGFLGTGDDAPSFLEALNHTAIVRGIWIGSRAHFEDMVRAIEANGIVPVVDDKVFKMDELKDAYRYLEAQKHFGKVCIELE